MAISIIVSVGIYLPTTVNKFNDDSFGKITILDRPLLLIALRDVQDRGVLIGLHGWEHENYFNLTPLQAKENTKQGKLVFEKARIVPAVFVCPYELSGRPPVAVEGEIEAQGVPTQLPVLKTNASGTQEYTWNWRTMKSFNDSRYQQASERIREENPDTILFHVQDWNPYVKRYLIDYLSSTNESNITIRVDDLEVNTPGETVYEMARLIHYKAVGRVVFAVTPAGTWRGGDPSTQSIRVNTIMKLYFWFFTITAILPLLFFIIWKVLSGWNGKKNENRVSPADKQDTGSLESVSIIIPAYNEEKAIGKCLDSALHQDYRGKTEIIVVNDGSSDLTPDIVSKYPVKLIDLKTNVGKANALNKAIEEAKGDILIFTDGDSYMASNAVSSLVNCFDTNRNAQVVAGNVFIAENDGKKKLLKYFQIIEYLIEQEISRYLQSLSGSVLICPGPLFAVRHKVVEKVRFRDESIVEDADFTVQALENSMKVIREQKAEVYTSYPDTARAWFTQRKRWWYGNLQLWQQHKPWAVRNAWMVFNYTGYIIGVCSLILFLLLPYFLLQYDNIALILLRGFPYIIAPILSYTIFVSPLFSRKKKLLPIMIPYVLIYITMKVMLITYLYLCYLTGKGVRIQFGPRTIEVK